MPKNLGDENTSPSLRDAICKMAEQGYSGSKIAKTFSRHKSTINRIIIKHRVRGHHNDAPRAGRPRKINERASRRIKRVLDGNRRQSLRELTNLACSVIEAPVAE
jgi:transposase